MIKKILFGVLIASIVFLLFFGYLLNTEDATIDGRFNKDYLIYLGGFIGSFLAMLGSAAYMK